MVYKDPNDPRAKESKLKHYYSNKEQYYARNYAAKAKKAEYIRQAKNRPCADCGGLFPSYVMDFDHLDGTEKYKQVSKLTAHSWQRIKDEIAKCEVVCANCHRIRTYERLKSK